MIPNSTVVTAVLGGGRFTALSPDFDECQRRLAFTVEGILLARSGVRALPAMSAWTRTPGGSSRDANNPEKVNDQDFIDPEPGKAISCWIFDLGRNLRWVSANIDRDTVAVDAS